jgi:N-6 DNA methylase
MLVAGDRLVASLGYADDVGLVGVSAAEHGPRDFVWRDLQRKCQVDAAYFKGAVPLVAFAEVDSTEAAGAAQRRLWNFGRVPVLIASMPGAVVALSCSTPPAPDGGLTSALLRSARPNQRLDVVLEEFTRFAVESGRAMAAHARSFQRRDRVDRRLLENLRALRGRLLSLGLATRDIERLIGRSIFVRYLEDRGILSSEHLQDLVPYASFGEALHAGRQAVDGLFLSLAEHFNGDVFASSEPAGPLPDAAFDELGHFFAATDLATGQRSLLPYDFGVIPTELVSSIYEQLLEETQRQDAAYYTPRRVVDLVLDEVLPWRDEREHVTILDPACGSGIFLTEAFKRLAYRHGIRAQRPPTFGALADLLTSTMFGVDRSGAAIAVSAFGLYLALLEHVDPPTAWRDARLPDLVDRNLVEADFFAPHALATQTFDIVVGNPPWKSAMTPAASRFVRKAKIVVPDKQIALAFLWRSMEHLRDTGIAGLLLPAKSMLHNRGSDTAERARRAVFENFRVDTLIDLSPLRKELFGSAINPAVVAVVRHQGRSDPSEEILHVVPRRTPLSIAIDGFVVADDCIRPIPVGLAATSSDVWKTYLWGGKADLELVIRLRERFPSLDTVAQQGRWDVGVGFQINGGDRNDASALLGLPLVEAQWIEPMWLSSKSTSVVTEPVMHRPRDSRIYRGPHILIRNGFRDVPSAVFLQQDAAFAAGAFGIAGSRRSTRELRMISGLLNSSVARYWYFMTSGSWGVEREKLELYEYLTLPVPPMTAEQVETIDHCVTEAARLGGRWDRQAELDGPVFDAFGLTEAERDLVAEGLSYSLDEFQHGPKSSSYQPPTTPALNEYLRVLAASLRSIHSVEWEVEATDRSLGYVVVTCLGHVAAADSKSRALEARDLIISVEREDTWRSPAIILQPSAIIVDGARVHVVKPDQLRSWSRSSARADASDVVAAILLAPPAGAGGD